MRLLPAGPPAAVMPGVPALLARLIGIVVVHVLSSTVGRARQRPRPETNDARECVDSKDHYGDEEDDLPPRHLDHHDPIWTTIPTSPAGSVETCRGKLRPGRNPDRRSRAGGSARGTWPWPRRTVPVRSMNGGHRCHGGQKLPHVVTARFLMR